jgi:hypothetical protein
MGEIQIGNFEIKLKKVGLFFLDHSHTCKTTVLFDLLSTVATRFPAFWGESHNW